MFLINAFQPGLIHRIIIQDIEPGSNFEIKATYIADTLDLFILAKEDTTYKLFKINMDDSNSMELDKDSFNFDLFFKVNLVITYDAGKVENQEFKQMFIRGDSEKAMIDTNTLLSIWLVHGDNLYNYTLFNKKVENVKIKKVCSIHSQIILFDQNRFIFLQNTYDENGQLAL